jgi:predicted metal-dependent enzyme (double-stranded beta helix superfamily)
MYSSAQRLVHAAAADSSLALLAAEIGAACKQPFPLMAERIKSALAQAAIDPHFLRPEHRLGQPTCYARHVIHADPSGRFTILALVWQPGQFSSPHAHHTWCGYAVCENPLTETLFCWDRDSSHAIPLRTEVRSPGYSCFAGEGLDQIHRLGNSGPRPAVSIHVYGVGRERIATHVNRMVDVAP